jgi:hypothetical protein
VPAELGGAGATVKPDLSGVGEASVAEHNVDTAPAMNPITDFDTIAVDENGNWHVVQ